MKLVYFELKVREWTKKYLTALCQSGCDNMNTLAKMTQFLTFWRRNYLFNFSTPCI